MNRSRANAAGFTLVEVVVATVVLSLLLLATVTALRTFGNTQLALERKTLRVDEIRSVSGFLRDLMESTVVGSSSNTGGLTLGALSGGSTYFRLVDQGVEWKSTILFGESFGGTHIVRVAREGELLVLRWAEPSRRGEGPEDWSKTESRTLVNDLEELKLAVRKEYDSEWINEWRDARIAPVLVRMQIKSAGRFWPDLVMQVQR